MELDFDVVDLDPVDHPEEGDTAPDFTRPLVNEEFWEDESLASLCADSDRVVLVFHAMDGAFPATYIWNELRDRDFADYDATVVGLSISTPYEHKQLIEERAIDFDLFSDPANGVAEQYGIVNDLDGMAGISEPKPAVYLLDEELTVEWAWVAETWPDFPPYDAVEEQLDDL